MASQGDARTVVYQIDADDRLSYVNENWNRFARENATPEIAGDAILGRLLWDFIADRETQYLYQAVVQRVRASDITVRLPLRCDAPDRRRFLMMEVGSSGEDEVRFTTVTVREEPRETVLLLDPQAARSDAELPVCSWCKRVQVGEAGSEWMEVEEAVARLELFDVYPLPRVSHRMCPRCREQFRSGLGAMGRGAPAVQEQSNFRDEQRF